MYKHLKTQSGKLIELFYGYDCLNKENGLSTLKSNSVDLCFTDPPWNIGYDGAKGSYGDKTKTDIFYEDEIPDYLNWTIKWFTELKRICKTIIITPGRQNLDMWYDICKPEDILIHYKRNGTYGSRIGLFNNFDVYLFFGEIHTWFNSNVLDIPATNQFLRERNFIHPSPKNRKVWMKIIEKIKPKSILDPFLGSGLSAYCCELFDISFRGYEIEDSYYSDWKIRHRDAQNELNNKKMF